MNAILLLGGILFCSVVIIFRATIVLIYFLCNEPQGISRCCQGSPDLRGSPDHEHATHQPTVPFSSTVVNLKQLVRTAEKTQNDVIPVSDMEYKCVSRQPNNKKTVAQ
jgi:hypothetical protein